jgi:hypothetical protein
MKTLYDLLGALPHDDAEGLKTAFRQAVKASPRHQTRRSDAALKFRQIVVPTKSADAEQRAAYDHLLELALGAGWGQNTIASRIHKLASGVIAMAGVRS